MNELGSHDVFTAIADPTRRQLLYLLADGEMTVGALSSNFPISRTAVSKHLSILEDAGLAVERKVGRERRWRLQAEPLRQVRDWLAFYERFWNEKLDRLGQYLETKAKEAEAHEQD
jgi:DNA-binding transcriptional ArsR family regulator